MLWFTADLHLGHASAIKFGGRPWANVNKMNDALINAINARVTAAPVEHAHYAEGSGFETQEVSHGGA